MNFIMDLDMICYNIYNFKYTDTNIIHRNYRLSHIRIYSLH